ncbi:MAG: hypothetical protein A3D67_04395 [Candidatus Lloydbacteria bacterium RIFCSPHIGHO2_02_FULL_51_22]|uniref:Beta-lactamase class A catalytic domain-containing protein n=2 Tax=Candidatus Lloydiibacteriota TaxID=1817910 RepID=A0A1G2DGB5_9BACT|nr:MAG: hypothetical protein A3D67_04395 [Candidatus Lloydbacteria bacterium RIFCSPHIGHO2_02_FULL_51_22]OGZ14417.1 MAG: hypothetical protein A3J08_04050 [Candidatus Lloydbacteria bacterium RIFCSPLOWO2_02_FULL_51_11]
MKKTEVQRNIPAYLIAAVCLLALMNATTIIWYESRSVPVENASTQYPFIDKARHFISQEHYLANFQLLRDELSAIVEREKDGGVELSLYFEYLNTGSNISLNQNTRLFPASLNKLPIAMAVTKKIENGIWRFDDKLVLLPADINKFYGDLYKEPVGSAFTIEFLLQKILRQSDNTAFSIVYRNLEVDEADSALDDLGLRELFDETGQITAKEYSRIFRALYTASFLTREHSQTLLQWLTESDFNDFLARGVPADIPFAHKFGINTDQRIFADSGIVYVPNRPYLLTVVVHPTELRTPDDDHREAGRIMGDISAAVFAYIHER